MKNKVVMTLLAMTVASAMLLGGCGNKETKDTTTVAEVATEAVVEETEEVTEVETETEVEEATEVPTEEPVTEEVAPPVVQTTMYAQTKVNVRSLPSTDGEIVGTLSVNDPVIVNGDLSADGWYTVTYCDQTAYIKGSLLGMDKVVVTNTASNSGKSSGKKSSSTNTSSNSNSNASAASSNSGGQAQATPSVPEATPSAPADNGGQAQATTPAPDPTPAPAPEPTPAPDPELPPSNVNPDGSWNAPTEPPVITFD